MESNQEDKIFMEIEKNNAEITKILQGSMKNASMMKEDIARVQARVNKIVRMARFLLLASKNREIFLTMEDVKIHAKEGKVEITMRAEARPIHRLVLQMEAPAETTGIQDKDKQVRIDLNEARLAGHENGN